MLKAFNEASDEFQDLMKSRGDDDDQNTIILIVDDEMLNIDVTSGLLFSKKISSSYALSGQTALEKIEERINLIQQSEGLGG